MKAPTYYLQFKREGRTWGFSQKVVSFEFTDSEEELDELRLVAEDSKLVLLDHPDLLDDGKTDIHFKFGFAGEMSPKKICVITQLLPSFPQNGQISIDIVAHDKGSKMTGNTNSKVWQKGKEGFYLSDIAEHIAKEYGLTPVVEPTKWKYFRKVQGNLTDMEFLQKLAKEATARDSSKKGVYKVYVQDEELHFHPSDLDNPPIAIYTYYTDRKGKLLSFEPRSNTQLQKGAGTEVESNFIDDSNGEVVTAKANNDTTKRTSLGKETVLVDAKTGEVTRTGKRTMTPEPSTPYDTTPDARKQRAKDKSDNQFKDAEMKSLEATAIVEGNPWLQSKKLVRINNVGKKYSGLWYITEVRHMIDQNGYTCELSLVRNAIGGTGKGEKSKGTPNKNENTNKTQNLKKKKKSNVKIDARTGEVKRTRKVDARTGKVTKN